MNPKMKQHARVTINATTIGNFTHVTMARKKKAPMASSSPWAKLSTLEDLKIMTKPMADRPYRNPILIPFTKS